MLNYLRSECYRHLRQRSLWLFFLFCLAVIVMCAWSFKKAGTAPITTERFLNFGLTSILLLGAIIFSAVFSAFVHKERGIHVQMISSGMTRGRIFFGDYVSLMLMTVVFAAVLSGISIAVGAIVFPKSAGGNLSLVALDFLKTIGGVCLVLVPWNAMALGLNYLVPNKGAAITIFFAVGLISYPIVGALSLRHEFLTVLLEFYPITHLEMLLRHSLQAKEFTVCVVGNLAVWFGLGTIAYFRREL